MTAAFVSMLLTGTLAAVPGPTESVAPPLTLTPPNRGSTSPDLYDNVAVPALQLLAAEGIVAVSLLALDRSDWGGALALALPATVPLSTCAIGATSKRHRGSCWHSVAGALVGLASGLVVYAVFEAYPSVNPWSPNPDDTHQFINGMASLAYVALIGIPVGSVAGWNVGKHAVAESAGDQTGAPPAPPPPALLPPSPLAFRGGAPMRVVMPLLSMTF